MLKGKNTPNNSYRPLPIIAEKAVEDSEESEDETVIGDDGSDTEEFDPSESEDEAQQLRDIEELEKIEGKGFVIDDEEDEEDVDYQSEEGRDENEEDDEFEDEDDEFKDEDEEFEDEDEDEELEENKPYEKEVCYKKTKKYGLVKKVTEYYPVKWS